MLKFGTAQLEKMVEDGSEFTTNVKSFVEKLEKVKCLSPPQILDHHLMLVTCQRKTHPSTFLIQ